MKLKKQKLNKGIISQKKRFNFKTLNLRLRIGNMGLYFSKENRIELIYIKYLRRLIKRLKFPKKVSLLKYFKKKLWFFLKKNFPLTKKSKNSRMGKGKGKFLRWIIRIPRNYMFFEFVGYELNSLIYVKNKINKKNFLFVNVLSPAKQQRIIIASKQKYSYLLTDYYINL